MKKIVTQLSLILFILLSTNISAQKYAVNFADKSSTLIDAPQYAVHFKDKNNSPYSIENPLQYLSQRSIDRRAKFGINITKEDFPVNPNYIASVNGTGAYVSASSRWANAVLVYANEDILNAINNLDFVEKIVYVKPDLEKCVTFKIPPKRANEYYENSNPVKTDYDYGSAFEQIQQINGVPVHKQGYTGEGVLIAVLDAGFQYADQVTGLSHLFESGRIVLESNVVEPDRSIYDETISSHGTLVLSCMGGFQKDIYVGTAPAASYALIRTEDVSSEYIIEEYFWMIGAEIADSLGADILNSSLGYTTFYDSTMDHQYSELDGKTAISSIAAKMAVARGIFCTNSAGNSGGETFPWVGSPADAPEVLTIGGVNLEGNIYTSSSIGPNGAGYPKPDVLACASGAFVLQPNSAVGKANGTSFASPIACGMVACVIQATPTKTPAQILAAVQKSADRYPIHDIQFGYGIPDFGKVLQILGVLSIDEVNTTSGLTLYPNPAHDKLYVCNDKKIIKNIELYDIAGKQIRSVQVDKHKIYIDIKGMSRGMIFVKVIYENGGSEVLRCVLGD